MTGGSERQISVMLDAIAHRGPDARGIATQGDMIHGHVRLSLLDLTSASNQPFKLGKTVLSYNGELWNWRELKAGVNREFVTNGDTEVLAALLEQEGLCALEKIDGMFAFAWSTDDGDQWLVRDAFGKVPLYVSKHKTGYTWASERKAFAKHDRPIPVPPGHALNLSTGEWMRWYRLPMPQPLSANDVLSRLREGVHQRLDADAKVCCLISGGMDSGVILALAKEARNDVVAYTAVFDKKADDLRSARKLCADLSVPLVEVPVAIHKGTISRAIRAIEIPSKAQTEIAVLCLPLAERIATDGFKACLSGEAADELFGGYGNFCIQASKDKRPAAIRKLRQAQLSKMSRGNFVRCNKVFMAAGVECRLPFMHQRLVEDAVQLDLTASPPQKKLLKSACQHILPAWCINRPKDTFQGGSGVASALAKQTPSPTRYYNAEARRAFGYLPKG